MWKEFKEFAFKGNVIDLAVGVIIGGAFSTIVNSVVNDLVMPLIGAAIAGVNFADLKWTIGSAEVMYGNFIQQVVNFFIVAFCIFAAVKSINRAKALTAKKEEEAPAEPEAPAAPTEAELLAEIRDLMKEKK